MRKPLENKLGSWNLIKGINTRKGLQEIDQKTRKKVEIHKALHSRDDIDRLYVSKKEGRRGPASIEDRVDLSIRELEDNIKKSKERLIMATRNSTDDIKINRTTIVWKKELGRKTTVWIFQSTNWRILIREYRYMAKKRKLKRETESLVRTAHNNAIRSNYVKAKIDKRKKHPELVMWWWRRND